VINHANVHEETKQYVTFTKCSSTLNCHFRIFRLHVWYLKTWMFIDLACSNSVFHTPLSTFWLHLSWKLYRQSKVAAKRSSINSSMHCRRRFQPTWTAILHVKTMLPFPLRSSTSTAESLHYSVFGNQANDLEVRTKLRLLITIPSIMRNTHTHTHTHTPTHTHTN
jgi:hypothetical protein